MCTGQQRTKITPTARTRQQGGSNLLQFNEPGVRRVQKGHCNCLCQWQHFTKATRGRWGVSGRCPIIPINETNAYCRAIRIYQPFTVCCSSVVHYHRVVELRVEGCEQERGTLDANFGVPELFVSLLVRVRSYGQNSRYAEFRGVDCVFVE